MITAEHRLLLEYLQAQRDSVLAIVAGLDEEGRHRSVVPSGWTPASMIMHLAGAERYWCEGLVAGAAVGPDPVGVPPERVYREQWVRSDQALTGSVLDDLPRGEVPEHHRELARTVRTVLLHLIEETARHAGHLDVARELIDGRTGLGPR
ncbi:DUF664 domain-containing protein [Microlunatus speluncae]|uniref:mycothiol transferase n=1 Tax=Microlunatus speluncae TaxID=2594267 RepID=UPI0012664054|nr:DUF664 domain-containing protein [Microlunatus speluncae]